MGSIVFVLFLFALAVLIWRIPLPSDVSPAAVEVGRRVKNIMAGTLAVLALVITGYSAVSYNDAGLCVHVRTIAGSEDAKCDLGWYFSGWGQATEYPHYITVSHTNTSTEGSVSDLPTYKIRLADNWNGEVTQTTRFGLPQDRVQFLQMARDYRSPERLIVTLLRPAVTSSLDSVANLYTMEEYWSGGKRDEFKTEFELAVQKGRPAVTREETFVQRQMTEPDVSPSDSELLADTAETGGAQSTVILTKKRVDASGNEIRIAHDYLDYGITASSAIIENLDPDDLFEERIQARKDAASRRIIAREQRLEQEEQRLLATAKAERDIAEKQGAARVVQIQKTTDAETEKRLALTGAERIREEARIAKDTAGLALERAKIDADAVRVTADAEAYQKERILQADNALQQKLDAEVQIQRVWAEAYAKRAVPGVVLSGAGGAGGPSTGADSEVQSMLQMLTIDAAKRLSYDRGLQPATVSPTTR